MLRAAGAGNVDVVQNLLRGKVAVDSTDYDGRTALHVAASEGQLVVVQLLKTAGADLQKEDRWHGTAAQDALRYQHYDIATELGADMMFMSARDMAAMRKLQAMGVNQRGQGMARSKGAAGSTSDRPALAITLTLISP